jgi:hypothetical protein
MLLAIWFLNFVVLHSRMVVEDKYKRLVIIRGGMRAMSFVVLAHTILRTLWRAAPFFIKGNTGGNGKCVLVSSSYSTHLAFFPSILAGEKMDVVDEAIGAVGVLFFLFWQYANGFGRPSRERHWAVKIGALIPMFIMAMVGVPLRPQRCMHTKRNRACPLTRLLSLIIKDKRCSQCSNMPCHACRPCSTASPLVFRTISKPCCLA